MPSDTLRRTGPFLWESLRPHFGPEQLHSLQDRLEHIEQAPDGPTLATAISTSRRANSARPISRSTRPDRSRRKDLSPVSILSTGVLEQRPRHCCRASRAFDHDDAQFARASNELMTSSELERAHHSPTRSAALCRGAIASGPRREGMRSAIQQFRGRRSCQPLSAQQFGEKRSESMVVEALFIGTQLAARAGLDE